MSTEHDPKIKVHLDGVAVPEVLTGEVPPELEEDISEEIQYENLALPEIHPSKPEDSHH